MQAAMTSQQVPGVESSGSEFNELLRSGQAAVLAQSGRLNALKKTLTASATAMAVAAMVAFTGVAPQTAQAGGFTFERAAIDTLGGAAGAGLLGQFGKGRGKQALRVVGAIAGVTVAESLQQPRQQQGYVFSTSPNQQQPQYPQNSMPLYNNPPTVAGGLEQMAPEKYSKLVSHEQAALTTRDEFARTLYVYQQAQENQVLNPRSKAAIQEASNAGAAAQVAQQQYTNARADFTKACEFMASRGYDVHMFAYSYALMQRQVTEKDLHSRDMAELEAPQPYARPAY